MKDQLVTHSDRIYDGVNRCLSVTVHETGNTDPGADAQRHADLQSTSNVRQASWHVQVDDSEAIRSYPDTAQCWHGGTREANEDSLAVEICVNSDGDYDEAFKNAAEVVRGWRIKHNLSRADVKQHFDWTGKNCPAKMRLTDRWEEFLNLTEPNQTIGAVKPVAQMVSPFEGRLTQNHANSGGYRGHKGMDIAPPKPGQTGKPIYAAFAGTVRKIHRTAGNGNRGSTWAPGRTGNGILISNPDGEGNGYNHMRPADGLNIGDKVEAGDLIGYNDRSGNQTAPHLHFELWADWRNHNSDYDPQLAFRKFGIKPGSEPSKTSTIKPVASKPKPKPAKKPASGGNSTADNKAIQRALKKMGLYKGVIDGVNGSMQKNAVKAYQRAHGLVADGHWGSVTQNKFEQVKAVQQALRDEGYTRQIVDGYYGDQTTANVRDYQRRVGLVPDGLAGPVTQKKLGVK